MNTLKLNQLEKNHLSQKEMSNVNGGNDRYCLCGCKYAGEPGGSSTDDNGQANIGIGDYGGYTPGVPQEQQKPFPKQ